MRAVIQRVLRGRVSVADEARGDAEAGVAARVVGAIGPGLVVLLAVGNSDAPADASYLAAKIANLRVFSAPADAGDKLNYSALELGREILVVSQFTLYGDCRKGRRPGFSEAAPPEQAAVLYNIFCENLESLGLTVARGRFRSRMIVEIINDGPVTLLLDSKKLF